MKRVSVLRTLVLALVLFALVVPFSLAEEANTPKIYLRGYVVDECGAGVIGAEVEVERVQTGRVYGPSTVKNDRGDWGVMLSATVGDYIVRVTLPNGNVVEWYQGAGDMKAKIADAVDEIEWVVKQKDFDEAMGSSPLVKGPITIVTDIPCTQPPQGPNYIWGTTYIADPDDPSNPLAIEPQGGATVTLEHFKIYQDVVDADEDGDTDEWVMYWKKVGEKTSQAGTGLFGFGISPVPGLWKITASYNYGSTCWEGESAFYLPEGVAGMGAYGPVQVVMHEVNCPPSQ